MSMEFALQMPITPAAPLLVDVDTHASLISGQDSATREEQLALVPITEADRAFQRGAQLRDYPRTTKFELSRECAQLRDDARTEKFELSRECAHRRCTTRTEGFPSSC